ncbi:MAG: hypothetical protein GWP08_21295 [Nitrospiraceae bacterium]|nr:hypothetical protein [Nitrospiraceae bacterium]
MTLPVPEDNTFTRKPQTIPATKLAIALLILLCGVGVLRYTAREEERREASQVWGEALLVLNAAIPEGEEDNVIPVDTLRLPESSLPEKSPLLGELRTTPGGDKLIEDMGLDQNERVVCGGFPAETLSRALASGRLPEAGKREVLAGDITRFESFELGGQTFEVVGRLQRGVGGLAFSYVLPSHESVRALFGEDTGAVRGWYHPEGEALLRERDDLFDADDPPEIVGAATRTSGGLALMAVAGLALVALGGAIAQYLILKTWVGRWNPFRAVVDEMVARPVLFWSLHLLQWGVFFAMLLLALRHPLANMRLTGYFAQEFTDGSLGYIGAAYASGNILRAASATFLHNYVVATLLLTILPSLLIPFAGVAKTALSFGAVAFAMSPMWTGFVGGLVYHSVTMTLELEAYVMASFVVAVYPLRILRGTFRNEFVPELLTALKVVSQGALLSGFMLAIAACYEAATLILLH